MMNVLASRRNALTLLVGLLVGLDFFENGMFVFASSHIAGGVDAGPREFAWVQAAYAIGSTLMIVLQQSLSRRFGYRHYLCAALALFLAGSVACAGCGDYGSLAAARFVQGFGGGALFTSARVLVPTLFPPAERRTAVRRFILGAFGGAALAPAVSAMLIDGPGWQWIFIVIAPLATLLLVACWYLLPDDAGRDERPAAWSFAPLLLAAAAVGIVQLVLSQARYDLFGHPWRLTAVAAMGVVLMFAFLTHQWHHESPMLHVRHVRHRTLSVGLALYFLYYLLANAANYLFPVYAERGLGLPTLAVGGLNSFAGAVTVAGAYVYFMLGTRLPNRKPLIVAGALAACLGFGLFSVLPAGTPADRLLLPLAGKGLLGAFMLVPLAGGTFREFGEEQFAQAYQIKNFLRQIAISTATGTTAVALQDDQFANATRLGERLQTSRLAVGEWLAQAQGVFSAQGLSESQSHAAALASVQQQIDIQSLILSAADLYRMFAVLAFAIAVLAVVQRRIH